MLPDHQSQNIAVQKVKMGGDNVKDNHIGRKSKIKKSGSSEPRFVKHCWLANQVVRSNIAV